MPVSVTVYYRDAGDRESDLEETLARLNRRISMLEPGAKLDAARERAEKVESRIRDLSGEEKPDEKMRAKFRKDMADLAETCRPAISPSSFRLDGDALVWEFGGAPEGGGIADLMQSAGMRAAESDGDSVRFEFDPDALDAESCNRIRLAVEEAARILWEAGDGQKANNRVGRGVHADEPEVLGAAGRPGRASGIAARLARGAVGARAGRGRIPWRAGGLRLGSDGRWLTPEAELILWIRELMKWVNREGTSGRDEIEAQVGARVANDPARDSALFEQAVAAAVGAGSAAFDGVAVSPTRKEEEEDEDAS